METSEFRDEVVRLVEDGERGLSGIKKWNTADAHKEAVSTTEGDSGLKEG